MKGYGKKIFIITACIGVFLFLYIRQVNSDREASIQQLFSRPEPGDIYKIRYTDSDNSTTVRYFKIAEQNEESIFFYRGRMSAWNVSDVFLDDYDTENLVSFSKASLEQLKAGKFSNNEMRDAQLVEIERKINFKPANSL